MSVISHRQPTSRRCPGGERRRGRRAGAATLCAWLLALAPALGTSTDGDRRARAGVRLFRSLLTADLDLGEKTLPDGRLLVVFFATHERERAQELAELMTSDREPDGGSAIRGLELAVELISDPTFAELGGRVPAGIFVAEPPSPGALQSIIRFGIANRLIVYSPYEGHVESGVLGGLSIEAQVRPYLNTETLAASHVSLKPFFMKVAKVYP